MHLDEGGYRGGSQRTRSSAVIRRLDFNKRSVLGSSGNGEGWRVKRNKRAWLGGGREPLKVYEDHSYIGLWKKAEKNWADHDASILKNVESVMLGGTRKTKSC